jgi:8-oxo-dGTP pyrophosphatase MutT (NUDIX family)
VAQARTRIASIRRVPANPAPAATVVLLRPGPNGPEALLTRRPATMTFAPDVHVFPGGRVDAADADPGLLDRSVVSAASATTALGGDLEPVVALAAYVAAIREAFEEVGILLADVGASLGDLPEARRRLLAEPGSFPAIAAQLDLRLRTDRLVPLSRWVTPPTLARRFDARFFAAAVPGDADADLVGDEVVDHGWHRPSDALDAMAAGTFELWLPTAMTLAQLEHAGSIDDIARSAPGRLGLVSVEAVSDDIVRIEMPAGGGVSGQPIDAYLVGRRRFVLVDPGDPTGPGLERAMDEAAARGGRIAAIAITQADPDHVGGAAARAARRRRDHRPRRRPPAPARRPRGRRWGCHRRRRRAASRRRDPGPAPRRRGVPDRGRAARPDRRPRWSEGRADDPGAGRRRRTARVHRPPLGARAERSVAVRPSRTARPTPIDCPA